MPKPVVVFPCGSRIDDEHATAKHRKRRAKIDGRRAFSDAALLVDERDDAAQRVSLRGICGVPTLSRYCSRMLQQQRPLVTFGFVGDLLEEPVQRGADALVAA